MALSQAVESLESRQLLSASIVEVAWGGVKYQAVANEYLIQTDERVDFTAVAGRWGFTDVESLGGGGFYSFTTSLTVGQMRNWTVLRPAWVKAVSPHVVAELAFTPNDTLYPDMYHLNNTGQVTNNGFFAKQGIPGADIDAELAWNITTGSEDLIVAVMDSGVDILHPDLAQNIYVNSLEIAGNGIDDDGNGFADDVSGWDFYLNSPDVTDLNGHGTHVAGTIGAVGNNALGVTGVAQQIKILPIKVGIGSSSGISFEAAIRGLEYVRQLKLRGENIVAVNASFGGQVFPFNRLFANALARAGEADILFVAAAGNDGRDISGIHDYPSRYSLNLPNVITVAATDNQDGLASFSNYSMATVLLAAPGESILSTWPNNVLADTDSDGIGDLATEYHTISGTSMATPVVTGILVLQKAARPDATAAMLKSALLRGVDYLPQLNRQSALSPFVQTSGRANALGAILMTLGRLVGTNSTLQGNWSGRFGSQGYYIPGEGSTIDPGFVTMTIQPGAGELPVASAERASRDPRALQRPSDLTQRSVTHLTGFGGPIMIDVDFADGKTHQVTLYAADYERQGRNQVVHLYDLETGKLLDGTVMTIRNGQYVTFDVTRPSRIVVTSLNARLPIVDGIFFDAAPSAPAAAVETNTTLRGNWRGGYGAQGALIIGDSSALPDIASVSLSGGEASIIRPVTRDVRALERVADPSSKVASWYTGDVIDVNVTFNDAQPHRVTLHGVDWQNRRRAQRVDLLNAVTGELVATAEMNSMRFGQYVTFETDLPQVILRVTRLSGPSAAISGVFIDAVRGSNGAYVGMDTTTRGNWRLTGYGTDAAYVIGSSTSLPPLMTQVAFSGGVQVISQATSASPGALLKADSLRDRIIAGYHTGTSMLIDVPLADEGRKIHRVSLYMVDPDRGANRRQLIEVIDTDSGLVVGRQMVANFQAGKYVTFEVAGPVQFRITRASVGGTAVVNGIFID